MRKALIISYYWPPAGGPGVQRWLKWVKYLPQVNIKPLLLTVDLNHAEYPIVDESLTKDIHPDLSIRRTKANSLYQLYKRFTGSPNAPYSGFANEGSPNWKQKLSRFVRGNLFLPDLRKGWNSFAFHEAARWILQENPECVITTGPPMSSHLIGQRIKRLFPDIKWIADFRDPWTDIYYYEKMYPTALARLIDRKMEISVLRDADEVIGVSPFVTNLLRSKLPQKQHNKFHCITNGFDPDDYPLKESQSPDVFTICYTGTMADNYPMDGFIDAVEALQKKYKIRILMVGKIAPAIRKRLSTHLNNIEFIGFVPHHQSVQYLQASSILLLVLPIDPGARDIIPGKVFEYIGSGTTTLCIGPPLSDAGQILIECHAGQAIDGSDARSIQHFIEQEIHKEKSVRYAAQASHPYSRQSLAQRLVNEVILSKAVGNHEN